MKKLISLLVLFGLLCGGDVYANDQHAKFLYPTVRVSSGNAGGSGTIIYSKVNENNKYSTYILTNHHVIANAIEIVEEWDSVLSKSLKKERRAIVYAEIFKYRNISIPVGTLKIEADIVAYNSIGDMALIKLRYDEKMDYIALLPKDENIDYKVFEPVVVCGCSLGFPPLPTQGMITQLNVQIQSQSYNMASANIVFGNSGGALYIEKTGELVGIPTRVAIVPVGFGGSVITHMGFFIPIERVYKWFVAEYYEFLYNSAKNEKQCNEDRKAENERKMKEHNQ